MVWLVGACGGSNNVAADSTDINAHQRAPTSRTSLTLKMVVEPMDGSLSAWSITSATGQDGGGHTLHGREVRQRWVSW